MVFHGGTCFFRISGFQRVEHLIKIPGLFGKTDGIQPHMVPNPQHDHMQILQNFDQLLVAGGLNKDNVCDVIREIQPFGVDVSSGVEKDGVKDVIMMKEFIDAVRKCSC